MAAPIEHMGTTNEQIHFPLRSGACLVNTHPLFSHDNKFLLVCSSAIIKVYSTQSGDCLRELCGHKAEVTGIIFHPTNKLQLISCSLDKSLIIWDYTDGVLLKEIPLHDTLHGLYTADGQNHVFVLKRTANGECDLTAVNLSKKKDYHTNVLIQNCSTDVRKSAVGIKGRYAATVKTRQLKIKDVKANSQVIKHLIDKGLKFTCVACHPSNECVATGCADGKIYLWYKFQSPASATKSTLHWHSVAIQDLCFSLEGSYLLSGGYECTLVKWHLDSRSREFLPRLGAPINHLTCSRDNQLYATCHDENVIQIISSNLIVQQVYQGLSRGQLQTASTSVDIPVPTGLLCDPRTMSLVMNGKPGHLQFFSVHEDKQLYNLDIVGHNYISPENLDQPLTVTEIVNADFDNTGMWLATTEFWSDDHFSPEIRLKFWSFNEEQQTYELNTTVEMAHDKKIESLKMRPQSSSAAPDMNHMAVTSSKDGKFKIWTLVDDTDIYRANVKWTCESVGFYRNLPAGETAFSEDGSLLAVVFTDYITLWDPENNLHKETLCHTNKDNPVRHLMFGLDGCSQYLVSATANTLTVWDLITCSVMWSVSIKLACLTRDPCSDLLAAFTVNKDLFVFRPSCPDPVFSHPAVSGSRVLSSVFIPHSKRNIYEKTSLSWQDQSELFFINEKQELQCVALKSSDSRTKTKDDVVEFEQNLPQTALAQIMKGHTNKSGSKVTLDQLTRQPDLKFIREIFSSASHVQPSVTNLCKTFIQSLMIKRTGHSQDKLTEEDSEEEEEMAWEPDSGVAMEMDSADDQSMTESVKNMSQSSKENEKSRTQSSFDSGISKTSLNKFSQHKNTSNSQTENVDSAIEDLEISLDWYSNKFVT